MTFLSRPFSARKAALAAIAALALLAGTVLAVPSAASAAGNGSIIVTSEYSGTPQSNGTVFLYRGSESGAIDSHIYTSGTGFSFTGLDNGSYYLEFTTATFGEVTSPGQWYRPTGVAESRADASAIVVSTAIPVAASISRALGGELHGTVTDAEGVAVTSSRVELFDAAGAQVASEIFATNAYSFPNLKSGEYRIHVIAPSGLGVTEWFNNKTSLATATPVVVTRGNSAVVAAIALDYTQASGAFSGTILGSDVVQPVAGITLELTNASDILVSTEITDADGEYTFDHLADGVYSLRATAGSGYAAKVLDTAINVPNGNSPPEYFISPTSLIKGYVSDASSGDPIAGLTVNLRGAADAVVATTVTRADTGVLGASNKGFYVFRGIPAGTYKVEIVGGTQYVTQWNGGTPGSSGTTQVVLAENGSRTDLHSELKRSTSLSGKVFAATGAPTDVSAVIVHLYGGDGSVVHAPVNADGAWAATGLKPIQYQIDFDGGETFSYAYFQDATGGDAGGMELVEGENTAPNATMHGFFAQTVDPTISGVPALGEVLTANSGAWTPSATLTYEWYRWNDLVGEGQTYTVTADDLGANIYVQSTGNRPGYTSNYAYSDIVEVDDPTLARVSGKLVIPAGAPAVDLSEIVVFIQLPEGGTVNAYPDTDGNWSLGGLPLGDYSFWFQLPNFSTLNYVEGNPEGSSWEDPTVVPLVAGVNTIGDQGIYGRYTDDPDPVIEGSAAPGFRLTATIHAWTPATSFFYTWYNSDYEVVQAQSTNSTYLVTGDDEGEDIRVEVQPRRPGYATLASTRISDARTIVRGFTEIHAPVISGSSTVGSVLTSTIPAWKPFAETYEYTWLRNGVPIDGALGGGATYTVTAADGGTTVSLRVVGNTADLFPTPATSNELDIPLHTFSTVTTPTITGTAAVGKKLTAHAGTWKPLPTFGYAWFAGGVEISGATSDTYVVKPADVAKQISVRVTGATLGFESQFRSSATVKVALQKLTKTPKPTISGKAKKGKTLTVKAGTWSPSKVTLTYQWERNGVKIAKATKSSYKLVAKDKRKKITVVVTGKKAGYQAVAKESSAKKVKK